MKENKFSNSIGHCLNLRVRIIILFILTITLASNPNSYSQDNTTITEDEKKEVITSLCERIEKIYISEDIALMVSASIKEKLEKNEYSGYDTPQEFAARLDKDLQELSNDKHLGITYNPKQAKEIKEQEKVNEILAYLTPEIINEERNKNFGFKYLEILDGNIGYLDLRFFSHPKYAGETAVAVMEYFSNCDALIIDLRKNGGGWGEMGVLLSSYFFSGDTLVQFGGSYSRSKNMEYQNWSLLYVPGKRLPDIPLYILTSESTFSAAEDFSYNLKHLGRAIIVGATTRGGAHPLNISVVSDFILYIPDQMSIHPVTKSNWEGVGVKPDIEIKPEDAFNYAYMEALKTLVAKTTDEEKQSKYQWAIEGLNARINKVLISEEVLKSYAGKYDTRSIYYENGQLLYQYGDRAKGKMIPLTEDYFALEDYDYVRVKFIKENGNVTSLEEIFDDGTILKKIKN